MYKSKRVQQVAPCARQIQIVMVCATLWSLTMALLRNNVLIMGA